MKKNPGRPACRSPRAHNNESMRRIGVLLPGTANNSEFQIRLGAFVQTAFTAPSSARLAASFGRIAEFQQDRAIGEIAKSHDKRKQPEFGMKVA